MGEITEVFPKKEIEVEPRLIAIATTTFYPKWQLEKVTDQDIVDKIRGDLALEMLKETTQKGYQIIVVDGGSSEAFKMELEKMGVVVRPELERGMSESRQQAFSEAAKLEGVKVICWTEPEKVSIIRDCLPSAIMPILKDEADIVIPSRTAGSFQTYPDYQVRYEQRSNKLWNDILRGKGLLPPESEDLDAWFGPKFFKNNPELVQLFLNRYKFIKRKLKLDQIVKPELWPNATFLPIVAALHRGFRVKSVDVPYVHPAEQTTIETDSPEFKRKRDIRRKNIIVSTIHFIRLLEASPKTRLAHS